MASKASLPLRAIADITAPLKTPGKNTRYFRFIVVTGQTFHCTQMVAVSGLKDHIVIGNNKKFLSAITVGAAF
jgi:hypothetical protein